MTRCRFFGNVLSVGCGLFAVEKLAIAQVERSDRVILDNAAKEYAFALVLADEEIRCRRIAASDAGPRLGRAL